MSMSPKRLFALSLSVVLAAAVLTIAPPVSAQDARADDEEFVAAVYDGLLGREPEPGGLAYWVGRLDDGASRSRVVAQIGDSPEQRRYVVSGIYRDVLDRAPDGGGLAFWSSELIDRISARELRAEVFASPEFFSRSGQTNIGFIDELYRRILNREAEASGRSFWLARLDAGVSRRAVAGSFLASPESVLQPGFSLTETSPRRGDTVTAFSSIEVSIDRPVDPTSSAIIVTVGGERIGGETQAVERRPEALRFVPSSMPDSLVPGRSVPVIVTVFADDGSRVEHVDYRFQLEPDANQLPAADDLMVAFYGHPSTPVLGVAGEGTPAQALTRLLDQAAPYEASGRRVVPVFEMIATLVTASPGPDGLYRSRASEAELRPYLDTIRSANGRLILDIQPGRADVADEARAYEGLLLEPDVGLALDPEWVVGPDQTPAGRIGTLDASDINRVSAYLSDLAESNDLPPRILIIHRFDPGMVTNVDTIVDRPGVRIIFHADGEGGPAAKISDYDNLMPPRFERGFKIFYDEDTNLLSPNEVLDRLDPTPAFVSYQ
jgi:hypothetical protein